MMLVTEVRRGGGGEGDVLPSMGDEADWRPKVHEMESAWEEGRWEDKRWWVSQQ